VQQRPREVELELAVTELPMDWRNSYKETHE
jgi:hypothetical protein